MDQIPPGILVELILVGWWDWQQSIVFCSCSLQKPIQWSLENPYIFGWHLSVASDIFIRSDPLINILAPTSRPALVILNPESMRNFYSGLGRDYMHHFDSHRHTTASWWDHSGDCGDIGRMVASAASVGWQILIMYWNVLQHWEPLKIPCASVVWCCLLHNDWWILDDIGSQRLESRGRGRETPMTQSAIFSWWTATTCAIPIDWCFEICWIFINFPSEWEDDSSYVIIYPHIPYICILYIIIYILCVCVFAIQVPHISPHCIATCPILVVFWTAKNQDDVVRQAIIPLSAPHQSDAGAVETAFFFLVLDVGICGDSMGFWTIQQEDFWYSDIWCYDAILVVLLRKASQPPSSFGNGAGNISCSQLDSRVV